jgi:glucose-6-phosphate isomerase
MLNARTVRQWLVEGLAAAGCTDAGAVVAKHMAACSTATDKCAAFGLAPERVFAFWDWVGGRYSVTSAVGLLPLALHFGWPVVQAFLAGARDMDHHFLTAPLQANVPVLMALLGVWNSQFQGLPARAIAPYTEALCELAAHVQQVDMESNGKTVRKDGTRAPVLGADGQQARDERGEPRWEAFGEVDFGQAGTNAQHSFFQLFHQGRVVPVDFIGAVHSQHDRRCHENPRLSNHDELMCNFFAQPDALATGRDHADPHRAMSGNRPSSVLLWTQVSAYEVGALLSLYEHRTAVQGFVWGINSFDQFGVELGKVLATRVRDAMDKARRGVPEDQSDLPSSTRALLGRYMAATSKL